MPSEDRISERVEHLSKGAFPNPARKPHNSAIHTISARGTPKGSVRKFIPYVWGAALIFTVLFWRLGAPSFWDPDEAHYAQTTRELIESGDWLAPYYNHQPFFDKPILFHVLQALPMSLLGPNEFAARLVPALAALALILTTWWLGAALVSADVGFLAALLLTISPGVFALSRYAILDTLFTAWLFGGLSLLTVAALKNRPRLQYGGYVLIAMATLTKGPLAIALSGVAFVIAIVVSADARRRLLDLHWVIGLGIVIAIATPWFAYMLWRFGGDFVDGYFLNENLTLFSNSPYQNQPGWTFYLQILAVGLLPWTFLLLGRLVDDVRGIFRKVNPPDTFEVLLWSWTFAIVGFFSLSSFKLDHYVFPAAPALCLLTARAWIEVCDRAAAGVRSGAATGLAVIGPSLIVLGVAVAVFMEVWLNLPLAALSAPLALIIAGAVLAMRTASRSLPRVPWLVLSAFGITYAVAILSIGPALEQWKVVPDVARWVAAHADEKTEVVAYRLNRWDPAFRFYVDRPTVVINSPEQAGAVFSAEAPFYCVMRESEYKDFLAHGVPLDVVYSRSGMWATSGKALWRQRGTLTNFVVVTAHRQAVAAGAAPNRTL
jgi:4-amino-4-deoxy-L-arabinose transferase-like glycosyltransferase